MLLLFYEVTSGMRIKKVWEYFKKGAALACPLQVTAVAAAESCREREDGPCCSGCGRVLVVLIISHKLKKALESLN